MSASELEGSKVFEIQFSRPFEGMNGKVPELDAALRQVQNATGGANLDVLTHSQGGTILRDYFEFTHC